VCGIAGILALEEGVPVDGSLMPQMLACLRHRGPDDEGIHAAAGIVLGHRRLSVIDVEHGRQPLHGSRQSTVAVVNGEIYNYRELGRELQAAGARLRTGSDSEVAAHAYDAWGVDCLERLEGMFALAVWDGSSRTLLLARDRMGEKPLFYTVRDGLLLFASELSALLAHPAVELRIDPCALREFLALEYVPAPRSIVAGVLKLEPGTALIACRGQVRPHRYWSVDPCETATAAPYRDSVSELRARLDAAVSSRLVSDVPLGVFLSGGIDSSTIAALAARHGALDTFSIGFTEPTFDESSHARLVARHIGSTHHEHLVQAHEMPELVPGLGALLDEPIGDASILPTAVLCRFARSHVTVALGGDGGDELFAGYPMHQARRVAPLVRALPRPLLNAARYATTVLPISHTNFSLGFRLATFLRGAGEAAPADHATWMASLPPGEQERLLHPDLLTDTAGCDPFAAFREAWRLSEGAAPLARATHLDALTYLPNDILTKVDRASMAVGLEVRAPFLARSVVEFAFSLPDSSRMRRLTGKRILRDATRDLLPATVLRRPKKGFGMPVAAWLNGPLKPLVNDLLGADTLADRGFFRRGAVPDMLARHAQLKQDLRKPIWTLLVLELWLQQHLADRRAAHTRPVASAGGYRS
jgi:asparagine synthase (glutamine-hydrolysing)